MINTNKSKNRIGIVGHFGGNKNIIDGQSIKVKSLYEGIRYHYSDIIIDKVDTYFLKKNPVKLFFSFLRVILINKKIIFLPAAGGRKVFFKLFYYIGILLHKQLYHDCIAGSLDKEIVAHPKWIKYLNSFEVNWMESPEQAEKLRKMGVENAVYLPNFKHIEPVSLEEVQSFKHTKPFQFCTFSRLEPQKGIEDALDAIREINNDENGLVVIDLYGPIQPGCEEWFASVQINYKDVINYKGVIDPHDSVSVLKNYFVLLFPTRYFREGMPGTIIDAMFAGLPVIARRWAWCDNMIKTYYNGISYDFDKPELLLDKIKEVVEHPEMVYSMKANCIEESKKYSEKETVKTIIETMDLY